MSHYMGRKGRPLLPRELRIQMFERAQELSRQGLGQSEVKEKLGEEFKTRVSKSNVSGWVRDIHSPYGGVQIPTIDHLEACEELAYVIGVVAGDGYVCMKGNVWKGYRERRIGMKARDEDFVEEFARCLTAVLGRPPVPVNKTWSDDALYYRAEVKSKTLHDLLQKPIDVEKIRRFVEHCDRCRGAFLRGFFDSEGCVTKSGVISIVNSDFRLLQYTRELLAHFGIASSEPIPRGAKGTVFIRRNRRRIYLRKSEIYFVCIPREDNMKFHQHIGFTIKRKQKTLEDYLRRWRVLADDES